MRLLYSAASPFARLVRIALIETGLDQRVEKLEISRERLYSPESDALLLSTVGYIPILELPDGTVLSESKFILDYIDAVTPGRPLMPRDGADGFRILAEAGTSFGFLQSTVGWLRALQAPSTDHAPSVILKESVRCNRIADDIESRLSRGSSFGGDINAAQIALGAALGVVEARMPSWHWRDKRPNLSAWYDQIAARPSFQATMPPPLKR